MLEKLDISGNQIEDEGAKDIANALEKNNKVKCMLSTHSYH